jgi:hypothetical protein
LEQTIHFLKFLTSCGGEILLDNVPSGYTSKFFANALWWPKSHQMSSGPTHAMCNVERDFTFDPKVLAWSTTNPLQRIKWCWMKVCVTWNMCFVTSHKQRNFFLYCVVM